MAESDCTWLTGDVTSTVLHQLGVLIGALTSKTKTVARAVDGGAGREVWLRIDRVQKLGFSLWLRDIGRQESGRGVGSELLGSRVHRGEGPGDESTCLVQPRSYGHDDVLGRAQIDCFGVLFRSHRRIHQIIAEREGAQAEGTEIERRGVELIGDHHRLRRGGGRGQVLKLDGIGVRYTAGFELLNTSARRTRLIVRVRASGYGDIPTA